MGIDLDYSKRYRIKRGDTLSQVAEKYMDSFPTFKRMGRDKTMDYLYNENRSSFGSSKDVMFEGKDLEIKSLLKARQDYLDFNSSQSEYKFTDEDKLVFDVNKDEFWRSLVNKDREAGEFMYERWKQSGSSSLPSEMGLNHKINDRGTHKDLMNEVKRSFSFNKVVSTRDIAKELVKKLNIDLSDFECRDLAKKLSERMV